ncbi:MAG TPA: sodium:proline symporter, partial [Phycisphaerae bacterium]|nr:sodium:proline symporter [Phycisphaerae bacterium]
MPAQGEVNTTILVVSFAVYTLGIVAVGLYSARFARRSDEDYFLAGRSLGSWVAALSASASSESGWV